MAIFSSFAQFNTQFWIQHISQAY